MADRIGCSFILVLTALLLPVGTLAAAPRQPPPAPRVDDGPATLQGLWGTRETDVAVFLGIPYAAPPVGSLRWQAPQPLKARRGLQHADRAAPACAQDHANVAWYNGVARAFGRDRSGLAEPAFSEDCLYLNVWTPDPHAEAHLPVLVWIHGGANKVGWALEPNYDGERLAARGQLMVSLGYRLGVFGFFSHPALPHDRPRSNFGLLDQIAALQWIHEHIAAFGGDPNQVTIAGESAGAADIGYLLTSPLAERLFTRAISESGGYLLADRRTEADAEQVGRRLAKALPGHPSLAGLRRLDSPRILAAARGVMAEHEYGPVLDGLAVPERPADAFDRRGLGHDLLIGSNQNEWYMYVDEAPTTLDTTLAPLPVAARSLIRDRALAEPSQKHANDVAEALIEMHCPTYRLAAAADRDGHRAFVYRFTRIRSGPGGQALLAYHGAEIPYAFDTHDEWLPMAPSDRVLTDAMASYWTAFVKTGDPNSAGLPHWPRYEAEAPTVQELGEPLGPVAAPDHALCEALAPTLYGTAH
jgi:para-nitrobenzyl esterase